MLVLLQGLVSSVVEVVAVCGFVFGVACKLPPPLTILLLSGVFWVVIARHFFWDICYKRVIRHAEYYDIDESNTGVCSLFLKRKLVPFLEFIALLMQVGALIAIPIILGLSENDYDNANKFTTLYILIPVTLTVISVVWSGWIQKYLVEPRIKSRTVRDEVCYARLKSGEYCVIMLWFMPISFVGLSDLLKECVGIILFCSLLGIVMVHAKLFIYCVYL